MGKEEEGRKGGGGEEGRGERWRWEWREEEKGVGMEREEEKGVGYGEGGGERGGVWRGGRGKGNSSVTPHNWFHHSSGYLAHKHSNFQTGVPPSIELPWRENTSASNPC